MCFYVILQHNWNFWKTRFEWQALSWEAISSTVHSSALQCTPVHFSALQCTPFFVTPVKRPLLNYCFFPDIRLDWESYNILPQDNQLLDMLVFVGQPLPVIQDGQEVVPAFQEQDCYLCEEKPFIQVKLREHEGIRANRPFEVTPSQQVWYTVSC